VHFTAAANANFFLQEDDATCFTKESRFVLDVCLTSAHLGGQETMVFNASETTLRVVQRLLPYR
jgi:hypothetical protein